MLRRESAKQVIHVLQRFRVRHRAGEAVVKAYQHAVDDARDKYDVAYQTIGDLCRRRLGLRSVNNFYNLLEKWTMGDSSGLARVLLEHTRSEDHDLIKDFFGEVASPPSRHTEAKMEGFSVRLDGDRAKKLKVLSVVRDVDGTDWLSEAVSQVVDREYYEWLRAERDTTEQ